MDDKQNTTDAKLASADKVTRLIVEALEREAQAERFWANGWLRLAKKHIYEGEAIFHRATERGATALVRLTRVSEREYLHFRSVVVAWAKYEQLKQIRTTNSAAHIMYGASLTAEQATSAHPIGFVASV